jgi:hypothetical protein
VKAWLDHVPSDDLDFLVAVNALLVARNVLVHLQPERRSDLEPLLRNCQVLLGPAALGPRGDLAHQHGSFCR